MNILFQTDLLRIKAKTKLNPKTKSALGQFFTTREISLFMASLFNNIDGDVKLLDPGCGPGSLTAAFVDEAIQRDEIKSLDITAFDIEKTIVPFITETLHLCTDELEKRSIEVNSTFFQEDFILRYISSIGFFAEDNDFTHIIMNPPYKKIGTTSTYRKALRSVGIETVNLYAGFVALAIQRLAKGGELVAIIPRSFCNGPYYKAFREFIIQETSIEHIHLFDSRSTIFSDDDVLQENIIIHLIKNKTQGVVEITSSPSADFQLDDKNKKINATDQTTRLVPFRSVVTPLDRQKFFHIAANQSDQEIVDRLACFTTLLEDLHVEASTGPVVDYRVKEDLREELENGSVPLIYPIHLNGGLSWPKKTKKNNAIMVSAQSVRLLWENSGNFVLVRRFSSKEEKRRINSTVYDGTLPGSLIGFDNKLNVFHYQKKGITRYLALGLCIYLNSTLLDKYYRMFSGHTQVNATDLRTITYPRKESLIRMGKNAGNCNLKQEEIDNILEKEIIRMTGDSKNPLANQVKINQALEIIIALGLPRGQQNDRSALTLLALLDLSPDIRWQDIQRPMIGVTPIMDWVREKYGKEYMPNSRETFRRQTLHQFIEGGLCLYNPDKLDRPVNSPKTCYQITEALYSVLRQYGTPKWGVALESWLAQRDTLIEQYAMEREMEMIPLVLSDGEELKLSPGEHSQLIHDIVVEFGPRFAPGSEVIYLGDTGYKVEFFKEKRFAELGIVLNQKGKLPDVVLYSREKDWLFLVESVTSHGPVDGKRYLELTELFKDIPTGLVFVTAFPDRRTMTKYLSDISWESEVWIAETPTHMIHFNGDKFLGPHK